MHTSSPFRAGSEWTGQHESVMPSANNQPPVSLDNSTSDPSRGAAGFKRAYKACEGCRQTKSRCELTRDSSACARCVRERRECIFPLTRSNKRARHAHDSSIRRPSQPVDPRRNADPSLHDGTSVRTSHSGSAGDVGDRTGEQAARTPMPGEEPQQTRPADLRTDVVKTFVTSSTDAMGLLFQAAEQNDSDSDTDRDASHVRDGGLRGASRRLGDDFSEAATSPWMSSEAPLPPQLTKETLALWNKHRFVAQGWFSAFEAISYIELYVNP